MAGTSATLISATTGSLRTNYARIGHAAQEVFPKLLQDLLAIKEPNTNLLSDVCNNKFLKGNLRPDEWSMINRASVHGYADFDISLGCKLIRNLNLVSPPTNGWNSNLKPSSTETTPGDDIVRIRRTRNEILHRGNANVSDAELVAYFGLFKDIARRLEPFLGKAKDEIVKMFSELESCSMDEKTEKMYLKELEILQKRERDLIETVEDLKGDVKEVKEDVKVMKTDVKEVKEDVKEMKTDVKEVKEDVKVMTKNVKVMTKDVIEVKEDVTLVTKDVIEVKEDVKEVTKDVKEVTKDVKEVKEEVKVMTKDVTEVKEDVKVMKTDVIEAKEDVKVVAEDVKVVTKDVIEVKEAVEVMTKYVIEVKEDVKVVKEDVDSDFMKAVIAEWQKENEYFVRTKAVDAILNSLTKSHVYCITGNSGIGKSASMHHVALNLQDTQGYQIFKCCNPSDICKYFKEGKKQVFVFDDVCGKYTLLQNDVEEWIKQHDLIKTVITSSNNTKVLTTSRSQIVRDKQFERIKLFQDKCCDLSADAYSLSYDMKLLIAKQYLPEHVVDTIKDDLDKYELLPLMFKLYKLLSGKRNIDDAKHFFKNPIEKYTDELNELKNADDKSKFCALFLVVIYNGFVHASVFTCEESPQVRSTRKNIFEACGVPRGMPRTRMQDQFDCLLDFFLKKSLTCQGYTTIHDKMFDVLCQYFGKHLQLPFIRYVDPKVLDQRIKLNTFQHDRNEYRVLIHQENYNEYMGRIVSDMLCERAFPSFFENIYPKNDKTCSIYLLNFIYNLDANKVQQLISATERNGFSLLLVSASLDNTSGDDVDTITDDIEETPLTAVCSHQSFKFNFQYKMIKLLIDNGANVNRMVNTRMTRYCPLFAFLEKLEANRSKANIYVIDEISIKILELLIDKGDNVNIVYHREYEGKNTPLTRACEIGDIRLIKLLIEKGADVNPNIDDVLESPLTVVCKHTSLKSDVQYEIIKLLLDYGANVNRIINNSMAFFFLLPTFLNKLERSFLDDEDEGIPNVIDENTINIIELLIDKGQNVNAVYYSPYFGMTTTPLTTACQIGNIRFIKLLMEKGANVDPNIDKVRYTPLIAACSKRWLKFDVQYEIIKLLLDNGANVNRMVGDGKRVFSPLSRFLDKTKFCYKNGSSNKIDQNAINILELLIDKGNNVNTVYEGQKTWDSWMTTTPLVTACKIGDIRFIKLLMEKGADVDPNIDKVRYTPLIAACSKRWLKFDVQYEIIKLLLDNGANVNRMVDDGKRVFSPLSRFLDKTNCDFPYGSLDEIDQNAINILELLIDKGNNVNTAYGSFCVSMKTPLTTTCEIGDIRFIKLLMAEGADVDPNIDDITKTPLTAACGNISLKFDVQFEIIKLLLDNGASVNRMIDTNMARSYPLSEFLDKTKDKRNYYENNTLDVIDEIAIYILELLIDKGQNLNTAYGSRSMWLTIPLTTACEIGNICFIKLLMERGADVDPNIDDIKDTPLTAACSSPFLKFDVQYEIIKLLLDNGANVNRMVDDGKRVFSPLSRFLDKTKFGYKNGSSNKIDQNAINILELLIDKGNNVNTVYEGQKTWDSWMTTTPLVTACKIGDIRFIKLLMEKGANVDPNIDKVRYTPLIAACSKRWLKFDVQYEIIKLLLDNGANVNRMVDDGKRVFSPLSRYLDKTKSDCYYGSLYEIDQNAINILELLIDKGNNVNTVYEGQDTWRSWMTTTPLVTACKIGDIRFINLLMKKGADVDPIIDDIEETPLTAACRNVSLKSEVQYETIKLLLNNGANVNRRVEKDRIIFYPLSVFLDNTDFNCKDEIDEIAVNILELLIDKGENVNTVYYSMFNTMKTPMTTTCEIGDIRFIKLLMEKGADVDPNIDDIGETPLTAACNTVLSNVDVQYEIIKLLLDKGANARKINGSGNFPIISMIEKIYNEEFKDNPQSVTEYFKILKLLLDNAADINAVNIDGESAFTMAYKSCDLNLIKFLKENGATVISEYTALLDSFLKKNDVQCFNDLSQRQKQAFQRCWKRKSMKDK